MIVKFRGKILCRAKKIYTKMVFSFLATFRLLVRKPFQASLIYSKNIYKLLIYKSNVNVLYKNEKKTNTMTLPFATEVSSFAASLHVTY